MTVFVILTVPLISQFVDISDDDYVSMMDDNGETKDDLKLPEDDVGKEIRAKCDAEETFIVTVLGACGEEKIVGTKTLT